VGVGAGTPMGVPAPIGGVGGVGVGYWDTHRCPSTHRWVVGRVVGVGG